MAKKKGLESGISSARRGNIGFGSERKEEKEDLFISFSERVISFIEGNRKRILLVFSLLLVLVIIVLVFSFLRSSDREHASSLYYDANLNIFEKLEDVGDDVLGGGTVTEDEVVNLVRGNKKLISEASSEDLEEVYLAKYTLGITYYSIGDYDNAAYYFKESYKHKGDFYLSFQALLNLGHSLYNRGYNYDKEGKSEKALESYRAAIETYIKFTKEFVDSPSFLLSYRYLGLASESLALLHSKMGDNDKAVLVFRSAKKYYEEYRDLAKNKEGKLRTGYLADIFMRRGVVDDALLGIRRVEISLEGLSE